MGLVGRVNQAGDCIEKLNAIPHHHSRSCEIGFGKKLRTCSGLSEGQITSSSQKHTPALSGFRVSLGLR